MKLTNQQIDDAIAALKAFNPAVSLRCKLRMSRNLRKLEAAQKDKEHDRIRLTYSLLAPGDKMEGEMKFTAAQNKQLQDEYEALQSELVDVELHPIELFDSSVPGSVPSDADFAIDLSKVVMPTEVLSRLVDFVFVEPGDAKETTTN